MTEADQHYGGYVGGVEAAVSVARAYEEAQAEAALHCSEDERTECEARSFAGAEIARAIHKLLPTPTLAK